MNAWLNGHMNGWTNGSCLLALEKIGWLCCNNVMIEVYALSWVGYVSNTYPPFPSFPQGAAGDLKRSSNDECLARQAQERISERDHLSG
jgi:hypothetical protein